MIFGILRSFGIEIGDPKFFCRKLFRRKKSENFWSKKILGPKNFDFLSVIFSINFPAHFVGFFFDEKFFDQKISDHLFRSQMIPRFRKSHLENCRRKLKPSYPKVPKKVPKKVPNVRNPSRISVAELLSKSYGRHQLSSPDFTCEHHKWFRLTCSSVLPRGNAFVNQCRVGG